MTAAPVLDGSVPAKDGGSDAAPSCLDAGVGDGSPVRTPTLINATPSLGALAAGKKYTLSFNVDASAVSSAETYAIHVVYTGATPSGVPSSAWDAATVITGACGSNVTVIPGTLATINVDVNIPSGATGADLALDVTSMHNPLGSSAASTTVPIRVGQSLPASDARLALAMGAVGRAAPFRAAQINGASGLEVSYAAGGPVQVPINVTNAVGGTWHYDVSIESPDATLWTVGAVTPNDVQQTTAAATQVHFPLTLLATAPSSEMRYLVFVATRQESDAIGPISNFLRIPIGGH